MKKKQVEKKTEGILDWAGTQVWKSGNGWHYRLKILTAKADQVIQIDCYNECALFAAGYVWANGEDVHHPELQLRQGDRVSVTTSDYKREPGINKLGQKYTRHVYPLNNSRELKVISRIRAVPPPPPNSSTNSNVPPPPAA